MSAGAAMDAPFFERLYARSPDPWRFEGSWYEARKRAVVLASLPRQRYAAAFEPACANGGLTAPLAARCDRLLACDTAAPAVHATRERLAGQAHVEYMQAWLPEQWPRGRVFDLVVLSEFLYYLAPPALGGLLHALRASLLPHGTVLACHWRHPIPDCALDGDAVHARLHAGLGLPRVLEVRDADFRLDVWCAEPSAAGLEHRLG